MDLIKKMRMETELKRQANEKSKRAFIDSVRGVLDKKGYRADLVLVGSLKSGEYDYVEIMYNTDLGYPTEKDLKAIVDSNFQNRAIDWATVSVDNENGRIGMNLSAAVDVIPLNTLSDIPAEFTPIGTAIYRKAIDETSYEVWSLKKDDDGHFALYRNHNDVETTASDDEKQFVAGDVVDTEYGPGKIIRFDDLGNAIVLVGSKRHLVAADEIKPYNIDQEKQKLIDYFTQAYGDANFAKSLVEKY